jgi:DNA polymerase-1
MIYVVKTQVDLVLSNNYVNSSIEEFFSWTKNKIQIEVDTETTGFSEINNEVICIQFGDFEDQFVIERSLIFNNKYKAQLTSLFESNILFLFQNALFDLKFLFVLGYVPKRIYDTFIAESCIHLGEDSHTYRRGLKDMAYNYLGISLDKEIRGQIHWKGLSEDVIVYAANDVKYLGKIKEKQEQIIKRLDIDKFVRLENEFVKALTYITLSGINLDKQAWIDRCKVERIKLGELKEALNTYIVDRPNEFRKYVNTQYDLFGGAFKSSINFNSSKQVIELFLELGLNLDVKDKKTGEVKKSVEANVLEPQKHLNELIPVYLDYKSQEKICSTYGENWLAQIHPKTGRIYTRYRQLLDTSRLSSGGKDKATKQEHLNLLNIPQDNTIRNCIIPKPGYVFVDCDYSGQETYVFAELSQEQGIIDFLNQDGGDMHAYIASKIYPEIAHLSLDDIKKNHKQLRQNAKAAGFAINICRTIK